MTSESAQLVKASSMLGVTVDLKQLKARYELYEQIKKELLNDNDYADIKTKGGVVKAIRKSGWFKFSTAFGLSTTILEERKETRSDKPEFIAYHFKVQCKSVDGRITEDVGSCDNSKDDREGENEHVIRAMAKTRATERAIIAMVGANEVAAEDYESIKSQKSQQVVDQTNFCKDTSHVHTIGEIQNNKCDKCGKMIRMT